MAFLPYGDAWRRSRKLLHAHVHPGVSPQYHSVQLTAAHRFVRDVLAAKQDKEVLPALVRTNFGHTIIKILYGIDVRDEESEYISLPEQVLDALNDVSQPGRYLVDLIPICENERLLS
jgi:cytochrome P450